MVPLDHLWASDRLVLLLKLWHGDTFRCSLLPWLPLLPQQQPNSEFQLSSCPKIFYSINLATAHRHCEVENRQGTEQQKKVRFASRGNGRRSTQQTALHSDTEHDSCQHCLSLHLDQLSDDEERVDSLYSSSPYAGNEVGLQKQGHKSKFGPGLQRGSISRNPWLPALWPLSPPRPAGKFSSSPPS